MDSGRLLGGEYRVLRMLAEGGMGVVYEAEQVSTGARRAIKVLRAPGQDSETWRVRFEREVRVSTAIDSDHVVHMVGAGVDEPTGLPWIAMELLDGEDLAQRLKRESVLDVATVRAMAGQLGHALAAAHRAKIVHRDLKPANVFLARSRVVGLPFVVKVLDFGIAKWLTDSSATPTPNVGTPAFMAPEQCGGASAITASADVWALGLLVFRMLTGHSFWLATREEYPPLAALMREVLFEPIPSASERLRKLDGQTLDLPGFDGWFARCVHRDASARFADAALACAALDSVLAGVLQQSHVVRRDSWSDRQTPESSVTAPSSGPGSSGVNTAVRRRFRVEYRDVSRQYAVDVDQDESLLAAVHRAGAPLYADCGGNALCTTCRVSIISGLANANPREGMETTVAQQRGWPLSTRLSCQLHVHGPMTVRRMVSASDEDSLDLATTSVRHRNAPERLVVAQATLVGIDAFSKKHLTFDTLHVLERFVHQMIEPSLPHGARVLSTHSAGVLLGFSTTDRSVEATVDAALRSALRMRPRLRHINHYTSRHFGDRFSLAVGIDVGDVVLVEMSVVPGKDPAFIGHAVLGANRAASIGAREGAMIVASDRVRGLLREVRLGADHHEQGERFVSVLDFVKPDVVAVVQETYERVLERRDEFSLAVYRRFLADPTVAQMFANSDMGTQRAMLMGVLHRAVKALQNFESIEGELRSLGRRHASLGVAPRQFRVLGQALIESLREFLGDEFDHDAELAWMELFAMLARAMIDGAQDE